MMRRAIGLGVAICMTFIPQLASADHRIMQIEHNAYVPCAVACPYWDHVELDRTCGDLANPGSYDQTSFAWTGDRHQFASFQLSSKLDWDMIACTETVPPRPIKGWYPYLTECSGIGAQVGLSCIEGDSLTPQAVLASSDGETDRFFIRSFMWLDAASATLRVEGAVVVTDNSFDALPFARPL